MNKGFGEAFEGRKMSVYYKKYKKTEIQGKICLTIGNKFFIIKTSFKTSQNDGFAKRLSKNYQIFGVF